MNFYDFLTLKLYHRLKIYSTSVFLRHARPASLSLFQNRACLFSLILEMVRRADQLYDSLELNTFSFISGIDMEARA